MATVQKDVYSYLNTKQSSAPKAFAPQWAELEELYTKKLWHQLTLKLTSFVQSEHMQKGDELIQLYKNFIQGFENKINPLALVEIIVYVVSKYSNPEEAITFLQSIESKVKSNSEAVALTKVLEGNILLKDLNNQPATKSIIEEVGQTVDEADGITSVHGRYYLLASNYYRQLGLHAEYYKTSLRYLGCIELSDLTPAEQAQHAFFLSLAALLGKGIYNLGELLEHLIIQSLRGTPNEWLIELLHAVNSGNIAKFESLKKYWIEIPDFKAQELKMRQKIALLCLMEMTFKRPPNKRVLTFSEIAEETRLPLEEVELVVMKAMGQGLVRGGIDQVAGTVQMSWVQPRVLSKPQILSLVDKLNSWCIDVDNMENLLQEKGQDFLTL